MEKALAAYLEELSNELENGSKTRPDTWFQLLKDHPYVSDEEFKEIMRGEYCIECGVSISHLPEGSDLCKRCFFLPKERDSVEKGETGGK